MPAIEPFPTEPLDMEPGWVETGGGHVRIYHGLGGAENVDYTKPVALAGEGDGSVAVELEMSAGETHYLAARAVSAAGVAEQNTHVLCRAEVDEAGGLVAQLARPRDVTAEPRSGGQLAVGFAYRTAGGFVAAEGFEILSGPAADQLAPLAVAPANPSGEHSVLIDSPALPAWFAVRARVGNSTGPVSEAAFVSAGDPPAPRLLV